MIKPALPPTDETKTKMETEDTSKPMVGVFPRERGPGWRDQGTRISVRLPEKDMRRIKKLQMSEGEDGHLVTMTTVILRALRELYALRHPEGDK